MFGLIFPGKEHIRQKYFAQCSWRCDNLVGSKGRDPDDGRTCQQPANHNRPLRVVVGDGLPVIGQV